MSHNTTTHRTSNNREYSSFLTSITHFFAASNNIGAMCTAYSRSDYAFAILHRLRLLCFSLVGSLHFGVPEIASSREIDQEEIIEIRHLVLVFFD
ncbi:hypothetical protein CsSME_00028260 [Camellia sinensis var. sinensis]